MGLVLAIVGILVAHVANNMMNDLADTQVGNDTEDYPRALYAPHPILAGLVTKKQLVAAILTANVIDLVIMIVLTVRHGWPIVVFALAGLLLSYAYTAPPLRLKKYGLGELDVLITWGPLMVGGVYFAGLGTVELEGDAGRDGVRAAPDHGADGQAHRQDPVRPADPDVHPAGAARRGPGQGTHPGLARALLPGGDRVRTRRSDAVARPRDAAGAAWRS